MLTLGPFYGYFQVKAQNTDADFASLAVGKTSDAVVALRRAVF